MASGALSAGVFAARYSLRVAPIAALGATAIMIAAYGTTHLRPRLAARFGVPDIVLGMVEDAAAVSVVSLVGRRVFRRKSG
jgi:uncharacterized membrane protein